MEVLGLMWERSAHIGSSLLRYKMWPEFSYRHHLGHHYLMDDACGVRRTDPRPADPRIRGKPPQVAMVYRMVAPSDKKKCPPKGAVVAESFLYYLQELTRSTSRGTRKDMSKCKVLRVCIPYGKASFGLREGTI